MSDLRTDLKTLIEGNIVAGNITLKTDGATTASHHVALSFPEPTWQTLLDTYDVVISIGLGGESPTSTEGFRGSLYTIPVGCYSRDGSDLTVKSGSEIVYMAKEEIKRIVYAAGAGWTVGDGREASTRLASGETMYGYEIEVRKIDWEAGDNATEIYLPETIQVKIGSTSSTYTLTDQGNKNFEWGCRHILKPKFVAGTKTSSEAHQPHKEWWWRWTLSGDRTTAMYGQDVDTGAGGNQYACIDNADNTEIDYFVVTISILTGAGTAQTRTVTLTGAYVGPQTYNPELNQTVYEGYADTISYADA